MKEKIYLKKKLLLKLSQMTTFLLRTFIYIYQMLISSWLRPRCRFLPTCSEYALDALHIYGPYRGSILTLKRICRCHPWGGHGFDPVKEED